MTNAEAVTIKNILEDWLPPGFLQGACARLSRSSTTHVFTVILTPDGLLAVLVRARA